MVVRDGDGYGLATEHLGAAWLDEEGAVERGKGVSLDIIRSEERGKGRVFGREGERTSERMRERGGENEGEREDE